MTSTRLSRRWMISSKISTDAKTQLITVEVTTTSPTLSHAVCRLAIDKLEEFLTQSGRTRGSQKVIFTRSRIEDAKRSSPRQRVVRVLSQSESELWGQCGSHRSADRSSVGGSNRNLKRQVYTTHCVNLESALVDEKTTCRSSTSWTGGPFPSGKANRPGAYRHCRDHPSTGGAWIWLNRGRIVARLKEMERKSA